MSGNYQQLYNLRKRFRSNVQNINPDRILIDYGASQKNFFSSQKLIHAIYYFLADRRANIIGKVYTIKNYLVVIQEMIRYIFTVLNSILGIYLN